MSSRSFNNRDEIARADLVLDLGFRRSNERGGFGEEPVSSSSLYPDSLEKEPDSRFGSLSPRYGLEIARLEVSFATRLSFSTQF